MMSRNQRWISGFAAVALALFLFGCDNSDNDLNQASTDVSGAWLYSDTESKQVTWALVQSDNGTIDGAGTDGAILSGLLSKDEIHLDLTYADGTSSTQDGTVEDEVMTGTYTNSASGSGTWSAVKTN